MHQGPGRAELEGEGAQRALDERALQAALPFFTHAILLDRAFARMLSWSIEKTISVDLVIILGEEFIQLLLQHTGVGLQG